MIPTFPSTPRSVHIAIQVGTLLLATILALMVLATIAV